MTSNILLIIVFAYNLFWAAIAANISAPFSDAIAVIVGAFPDPHDYADFLGNTNIFTYGAAIIWNVMERIANFFIAGAALLLPWELSLYGQTVDTTGLAIFNIFINGIAAIYFKDQILAIAEAVIPF